MASKRKRPRKRDYKAEYQRRIARATARGYTRDIARGHPRKGKAGIKASRFLGLKPGQDLQDGTDVQAVFRELFPHLDYVYAGQSRNGAPKWRLKVVVDDARKRFGVKPRRDFNEDTASYEEKLEELQRRQGSRFDWTDERAFVKSLTSLGLTEQDAYTHWFSP